MTKANYRAVIYENIIWGMWSTLNKMRNSNCEFTRQSRKLDADEYLTLVSQRKGKSSIDSKLAEILTKLWEDVSLQHFVKKETLYKDGDLYSNCVFRIDESLPYYLNNLNRIAGQDYIPSTQDILMCRIQTTGIVDFDFVYNQTPFRIIDVGGQR